MAKLKVMCARSMHLVVGELGARFAAEHAHDIDWDFGTVGGLQKKLDAGETADVMILSAPMIDAMTAAGTLIAATRADVAMTFVAICVRADVPRPAIGDVESFVQTLRDAPAIAYSGANVGGSAGIYLTALFERMGLAEMMAQKGSTQQTGVEVARRVLEGAASIGLTLSGEIASVPGVVIAGPLPPPIGSETRYVAAVSSASAAPDAARAFIIALTAPETLAEWRTAGFEQP